MSQGPFQAYAPPGVYTRTLNDTAAANQVAGLRIPAIIGVGQEELEQLEVELVRGSSAAIDQEIFGEDVSASWIVNGTNPNNLVLGTQDGTIAAFRVRNFPIVDGEGNGRITNDVRTVSVTVNGVPAAVGSIVGASGVVTLQVPTQPGDIVRVTYFFHRGDTAFTDNVSAQVTAANATLVSPSAGPFTFTATSNVLNLMVGGSNASVTFPVGALSASTVATTISAALIPNLLSSVFVDNAGAEHLHLTSPVSLRISEGTANLVMGWSAGTATARNATFRVFQRPIVDGSDGGITTTDPSKVVVKVNGSQVLASSVDGANGTVTLASAPAPGAVVTIQYWANTWQDTFDYLPNSLVSTVLRCGVASNRSDYIQGVDFIVSNPSTDVSVLHWGAGSEVVAGVTSIGAKTFDGSVGGQVVSTLVDDKMWLGLCSRVTDTSTIPAAVSKTEFLLPEVPTLGNGRNTTLGSDVFGSVANSRQGLVSNRPDLVTVYTGRNLTDALSRPAVAVKEVVGADRKITLAAPQHPDYNAYATFYYSRLTDDTFTITNTVAGPVGVGQYTIDSSTRNAPLYAVRWVSKSGLSETVQWPRGSELIPDAYHAGSGTPVSENVTVTFTQSLATNAAFTTPGAAPYSIYSAGSNNFYIDVNNVIGSATNLNAAAPATLMGSPIALSAGNVILATAVTLNVEVDGVSFPVTLSSGPTAPAAIVLAINTAIGAAGVAAAQLIGTSQVVFSVQSATVPSVVDSVSTVQILGSTGEEQLGFSEYKKFFGTLGAVNKAPSMLGSVAGPFNITAGLNDTLKVRVDGVDRVITLTAGASRTAANVVADINAVVSSLASVGTAAAANKVRLTGPTNTAGSALLMQDGTANDVLGFTQGSVANQVLATAEEIAAVLNASPTFFAQGFAYVQEISGQKYLTIESLVVGTGSSIVAKTSVQSAFNPTTGLGIAIGDGDLGEAAKDMFTVTSSHASGSAGTGAPGQTYTDSRTGLRFTVLPSTTGSYTSSGSFVLEVSPTHKVNPSIPTYAVGGVELLVTNTVDVGVNDTSILTTFDPKGVEPSVGDFYYVSYLYGKQDYSPAVFQQIKNVEANFGRISAENRLSLGCSLASQNGAVLMVAKQVKKVPNTNQANVQDFQAAIQELASPLRGNIRPNIVVPLATNAAVYSYLTNHCEVQSGIRYQNERMGFIGFASGTSPTTAQQVARGLNSSRIVAFYPDSAVITITDSVGRNFESLVDGSFFAAAMAGAAVSPAVDVATPYTRRRIVGFTRIPRLLDSVEANQTAVAGVTLLEDLDPIIRIRHGLTTNMTNVLTRTPSITQIQDHVHQQARAVLDSFVGAKFLANRANEVTVALTGLFRSLVQDEIVKSFGSISAEPDPNDVSVLNVEMAYVPINELTHIVLTFSLRSRSA